MRTRIPLAALTAAAALATCVTGAAGTAGAAAAGTGGTGSRHACSPSVAVRGYSDSLDKTVHGGLPAATRLPVAGISALAPDAHGRIAALSDRSALFSLDVNTDGGAPHARTVGGVRLADEKGAALDAEGLVVERDGSRLVSSETEPSIRRYDREGALTGQRLAVPDALRVAPAGRAQQNQTFEGLTARHGGRSLVASMEGPLADDGKDAQGRPLVRFQSWNADRGHGQGYSLAGQWGYPVDEKLAVAEVTDAGHGRLLVLERGFDAATGNTIRLYLADPRRASDVSRVDKLTGTSGARLVHKKLLADLGDCPDLGAPHPGKQRNPLLDNIEAMAVTGRAPGGRLRLLLASDDNESAKQVTRLYAFTVRLPRP